MCKVVLKTITHYYSVIHWLSFGTYWQRICKIFPKYCSSLCIHAWGRWCDSRRDSQVTTPSWERQQYWREGLELKNMLTAWGRVWKGRMKYNRDGMISYTCDRTTTCTNTDWKTNGEAVILQGIWSSDSGCHLMWGTEGVNLTKEKQTLSGSV